MLERRSSALRLKQLLWRKLDACIDSIQESGGRVKHELLGIIQGRIHTRVGGIDAPATARLAV